MKKFYYLFTLVFVFCIPSVFAGFFLVNYISLSALIPFVITVTIIGSIWDVWATRHSKKDRIWLWQFNKKQTIGIKFLGLPIEEYVFYTASSVYVIFMWEGIKLMILHNTIQTYSMVLLLSIWTVIAIGVPYIFAPKKDKFIG
jgi:lycopene cyclase domain-containing protein